MYTEIGWPGATRGFNLNSEVETLRFRGNQRRAGFPACRFAGRFSRQLGDRKVARTRRQECRRYQIACQLPNSGSNLGCSRLLLVTTVTSGRPDKDTDMPRRAL